MRDRAQVKNFEIRKQEFAIKIEATRQKKEKTTHIALILKEKFQKFQNLQVQGQRYAQPSAASSLNANHVNFDDEDMG